MFNSSLETQIILGLHRTLIFSPDISYYISLFDIWGGGVVVKCPNFVFLVKKDEGETCV